MSADEINDRLPAALIGDVIDLDACGLLQQFRLPGL